MGVGSTGVAALELGRRFIGVEVEPLYFGAAKDRVDKALQCGNDKLKMINNKSYSMIEDMASSTVCEELITARKEDPELDAFFQYYKDREDKVL